MYSVFSDDDADADEQEVHVSAKAAATFGIPALDRAYAAHLREQEILEATEGLTYFEAMGLDTEAVTHCRRVHPDAVSNKNPCVYAAPHRRPTEYYCDGEEFSYTISPVKAPDTDTAKQLFADWLRTTMTTWAPTCNTLFIGFDQRTRTSFCIPKQVHTGDERAKRRAAKVTEEQDEYEALDEEQRKRVVTRMVVDRGNHPLPTYWHSYMSTREGRWALYQLMVWTVLDPRYFTLPVGKTVCFFGLPFVDAPLRVTFDDRVVHGVLPVQGEINQAMLDADGDLFSRCLMARGHKEHGKPAVTIFMHWKEWDIKLWEADYYILHLYRFMPHRNWLVRSNDRDMLLTLLAQSIDRRVPNKEGFQDNMWLFCPNKSSANRRKKAAQQQDWVGDYFWDINRLYDNIDSDDNMSGHVYNRVMTFIFVMLLTGCDHVRKDMFFGLNPVENILKCLSTYHERYQHMVQLSQVLIPDPSAIRLPLVDERAAIEFMSRCYLLKYSGVILNKRQKEHEKLVARRQREYESALKRWEKACDKLDGQRLRYAKKQYKCASLEAAEALGVKWPAELAAYPQKPVLVATPPMEKRVSREDVRAHAHAGRASDEVKEKRSLPTRDVMRRDVRYATWALYYLINGGRDQSIFEPGGVLDPLQLAGDGATPYWGYEADPARPGKYRMSDYVYEEQDLRTLKFPQSYLVNMFDKHRERKARERRQRQQEARDSQTEAELMATQRRKKAVGQQLLAAYGQLGGCGEMPTESF